MTEIEIINIDKIDMTGKFPTFKMKVKLKIRGNLLIHRFKIYDYDMFYYIKVINQNEMFLYFIRATDSKATQKVNQKLSFNTINKIKQRYKEIHNEEMFL